MPLLKAYLWTDGRGVVALYPAAPAAKASVSHAFVTATVSESGHRLSGRGR